MSEAVNNTFARVKEHVPSVPAAADIKDAVSSHLPAAGDAVAAASGAVSGAVTGAIQDAVPVAKENKKTLLLIAGVIAALVAVFLARR
jgi:hypothetical protein